MIIYFSSFLKTENIGWLIFYYKKKFNQAKIKTNLIYNNSKRNHNNNKFNKHNNNNQTKIKIKNKMKKIKKMKKTNKMKNSNKDNLLKQQCQHYLEIKKMN